jgi:hypothetical protein
VKSPLTLYISLDRLSPGSFRIMIGSGRIRTLYKPKLELINELDPLLQNVDRFLRFFPRIELAFSMILPKP